MKTTPLELRLARSGEVTSRNFERLGYQRLVHGVYGRPRPADGLDQWQQRRLEYLSRVHAVMAVYRDAGAVLFGVTALEAMGVALPQRLQDWDQVHILVPPGVRRSQRDQVVAHAAQQMPLGRWRVAGLPASHPVDHWMQLRGASDDELVEVGDGLMRRTAPILTLDQMSAAVAERAGRPGARRVMSVMRWVAPGTDSLPETSTRLILVHAGLGQPVVNCPVFCSASGQTLHVDMGYEREKVAIEYDGAIHVQDARQMQADAERRRKLVEEGWIVIPVTAVHLRQPQLVIRTVETALLSRRTMARLAG